MSRKESHIEDYLKRPYSRVLIPDPESGTFTARILEFPGCFAEAKDPASAYRSLDEAARSWLAVALALGQTIPEPSVENEFSGRLVLRMPRSLHRSAPAMAERDATSLNQFIVAAVSEKVGATSLYGELAGWLEKRILATDFNRLVSAVQIHSGWKVQDRASTPPHREPGVNLRPSAATGVN